MPPDERSPAPDHLRILTEGEVELVGRLPWSSNGTFLVTCSLSDCSLPAVYKPEAGERPLWDFPPGIFRREVAAWILSDALGLGMVPETVVRHDAPLGVGSLQRFVDADFSEHYFTLLEHPRHHDTLRRLCIFDVVANNADRKSGHCLLGRDGRLWAIDHGLCFHRQDKLRTVMWDFAGDELPREDRAALERVAGQTPAALDDLLEPGEVDAIARRAEALLRHGTLPEPDPDRHHYPWPLV